MTIARPAAMLSRRGLLIFCGLLFAVKLSAEPAMESTPVAAPSFPLRANVDRIIDYANHPYLARALSVGERNALKKLYRLSPRALVWLSPDDRQTGAAEVVRLLENAPDSALPTALYGLDVIKSKWSELQAEGGWDPVDAATLDTALSLSTLRFLNDVRRGRIDDKSERFGFWRDEEYDALADKLLEAVRDGTVSGLTERVEPDLVVYKQLKRGLAHYRELARDHLLPSVTLNESLKEGGRSPQVPVIREKLRVLGLLQGDNGEDENYQGEVVDAVKRFQRLRGLNQDGVVGKKTLAALNTPLSERVRQIEMGLERLRWLPELNKEQGLILVNVPAFRLWAYPAGRLDGNSELSMKVVVGIAKKNQTPIFMADLAYLEFRPYWNVPRKIAIKEIVPNLLRNPNYLRQQNMELVQHFSSRAVPQPFNEESLALLRQGAMKIRQRPGAKNSLGLVKFIFPNNHDVYMHDTPAKRLFRSDRRDFSHGCIRVEQPQELAEFVLRTRQDWHPERIEEAMQEGKNRRVSPRESIAVLIFYSTAMAIDNEMYFFEDIYDYDERLGRALDRTLPQLNLASAAAQ